MHGFNRGVVSLANAKDDLVLRVILNAVTAKAFVHLGINAAQRFQDGNRRREQRLNFTIAAQEAAGAPYTQNVKAHAAHGKRNSDNAGK